MRNLSLWIAGLVLSALHCGASAQTISQPVDNASGNVNMNQGQSFVATLNGTITDIGVRPAITNGTVTLHIYTGGNGSGIAGAVGAPAYSQPGNFLTTTAPGGAFRLITLAPPFAVTAGQTYTFILSSTVGIGYYGTPANPYAGGEMLTDFATPFVGRDQAFQIFEVAAAVAPASVAAVPGLGTWAAGALAIILACSGAPLGRGSRSRLASHRDPRRMR